MKYKGLLCLPLFFLTICLPAQFTLSYNGGQTYATRINSDGEIFHSYRVNLKNILSKFDTNGGKIWSKEIIPYLDNKTERLPVFFFNSITQPDGGLILPNVYREAEPKIGISKIGRNTDFDWSKLITYKNNFTPIANINDYKYSKAININNKESIVLNYLLKQQDLLNRYYHFTKFDTNGNILNHVGFKDTMSNKPQIFSINQVSENTFSLIRTSYFDPENTTGFKGSFIQIVDEQFNVTKSFSIDAHVNKVLSIDNRYYLLAQFYNPHLDGGSSPSSFILICLSENLNVEWSKQYNGLPNLSVLFETLDGLIVHNYAGNEADFFTLFDLNGNVIKSKLIPKSGLTNWIDISKNHLVHAASQAVNNFESNQYITCSSLNLENEWCFRPNLCIDAQNYEVVINIEENLLRLEKIEVAIEVEDILIQTKDIDTEYTNFCNEDFAGLPVPLFDIPDTVCVGSLISIINLQNEEAQEVQWTMPGSDVGESELNFPPPFSYDKVGTYDISQWINYFGCTNEYTQTIVVVDPIDLGLESDILLCEEEPYLINANHENALAYTWNDGSRAPSLLTNTPGQYAVEVQDRYCTQNLNFEISYFDYALITPTLVDDTIICLQSPLLLADSLDAKTQALWTDSFTQVPREISETGFYQLTTSLNGCSTVSNFNIHAEDCSTQIFMPNVFSPNNDGINDSYYPLGNFFEVISFEVFNQWGELIHSGDNPWLGNSRGKLASEGVYTYTLQIKNLKLEMLEMIKGDFTLIR